ncbi:MAG TPA: hypothetical protein VGL75_18675 [Acidothermaceae bacterium]
MPTIDEILHPYVTTYLALPIVTDWSDGFPVREITVAPGEALALADALRRGFADTKIWPLVIDGLPSDDTAASIRDAIEPGDEIEVGQAAINASVGLDPLSLSAWASAAGTNAHHPSTRQHSCAALLKAQVPNPWRSITTPCGSR